VFAKAVAHSHINESKLDNWQHYTHHKSVRVCCLTTCVIALLLG